MATSDTYAFNLDVDEVIREASELVGGEVTLGNDVRSAKRSLNLMLVEWQNKSINLWTVGTTVVSVAANTTAITLDSSTIAVLSGSWQVSTNQELQMGTLSNQEYLGISNKGITGRPNQYVVRRNRDAFTVSFYPVPDNSTGAFKFEKASKIQDVNRTAVENVDVPTQFLPALTMGLAFYMGMKKPNMDPNKLAQIENKYGILLSEAMETDRERTSLFVKPRLRRV
jgi:hypothetical protein